MPRYLEEAARLHMPFVMHFDRCDMNDSMIFLARSNYLSKGYTFQPSAHIEFDERHKQQPLDLVRSLGYGWAMAWDIDEIYEREAPAKIYDILRLDADYVDIIWLNLWNDLQHIRIDGPFGTGHRVKFLNLRKNWAYYHPVINGPRIVANPPGKNPATERSWRSDLVCLHLGMMTQDLRLIHKTRWDRIYTKSVGANPYGFWNYALDPNYPPIVVEHDYLTR